jgi:hypothetical protein
MQNKNIGSLNVVWTPLQKEMWLKVEAVLVSGLWHSYKNL